MQFHQQTDSPTERRYDAETLRRVTALAQQLQESDRETLTADQVEAIGEEVGLGRAFVRDALRQIVLQESREGARRQLAGEFRDLAAAWGLGAAWSVLAWAMVAAFPVSASFFTLIAPPLLAILAGFLAGKPRAAAGAGALLALGCALVFGTVPNPAAPASGGAAAVLAHFAILGPLSAWLAAQGARVRRHYFPRGEASPEVSPPALLEVLVAVQRELDERTERRAFLSVEVAGAREIRQSASGEAAMSAFVRFREWAEQVVRECGGEPRPVGEDGLAAVFATDEAAVRAARRLQEEIDRFNVERSRISTPLRLRCGLAAGRVPAGEEAAGSPVAAALRTQAETLQRRAEPGDILVTGELAAAALLELRMLAPLSREAGEVPVFSWRAAQRAQRRP